MIKSKVAVGSLPSKSVFSYGCVNWIVLDNKDSKGVLCLAENVLFNKVFAINNDNNWEDSLLRKHLNNDFFTKLVKDGANENAFVPMLIDLTADDGLNDYGSCEDIISLISCQQYRKYRGIIPNTEGYWWTCTAYSTKANGYFCSVRSVGSDGALDLGNAYIGNYGVRPLCILQCDTLVSVISKAEYKKTDEPITYLQEFTATSSNGLVDDFYDCVRFTMTAYKAGNATLDDVIKAVELALKIETKPKQEG